MPKNDNFTANLIVANSRLRESKAGKEGALLAAKELRFLPASFGHMYTIASGDAASRAAQDTYNTYLQISLANLRSIKWSRTLMSHGHGQRRLARYLLPYSEVDYSYLW